MVYRRCLFGIKAQVHIMARTAQISKVNQQSIITLRHEIQSIWNISLTLKVSSSTVARNIKRYDKTGSHEDRHRNGRLRVTSAAEDKFIRVTSLRNCSPKNCLTRVQVTDTSQHQLFRGDSVNQAFMVELLQSNHYLRTPIRRRALLGPQKISNGH